MATRKDLLMGLSGLGMGISRMGAQIQDREQFDTKKALEEEEAIRQRELHPIEKETATAQAGAAKLTLSELLSTADKRKGADSANQALMAENEAAGWKLDPDDQPNLGTWKAELNAVNRFRAKEGKPALSVDQYITEKRGEKTEAAKSAFDLEAAKGKESRSAAESTAGLGETAARTKLLGAQTLKTKAEAEKEPTTKETKLTEAQSKTLGAAGMAKTMLDDLANQFKGSKLGGMKGFAADVVESVPVVGGKMAPETNAYNDKRRITAETFLREATGAAAPAAEIKFYTNLLPEPGDSEDQAQSSLNAFRGAVMAKVHGVAATLRAQGKDVQADEIETRMKSLFDSSVNIKDPAAKPAQSLTLPDEEEEYQAWKKAQGR